MCWADKVPLVLAALIGVVVCIATSTFAFPLGAGETFFKFMWAVATHLILPVWMGLRVLDLLCRGPARRRRRLGKPPITAALMEKAQRMAHAASKTGLIG
jgi:hypothetical protein